MIEEETGGVLDFEALRDAVERRDPDLLLGFYAEDAGLRVVNAGFADGPAFELHGRAEIERYLRVVFDRRTPGRVRGESVGEEVIAFEEVCEYPDGTRVVVRTTLELRDGRISRQLDVVEQSS
ncbi:MAG: nuclear transport factor 2 family protein [Rubrobacter sp.]